MLLTELPNIGWHSNGSTWTIWIFIRALGNVIVSRSEDPFSTDISTCLWNDIRWFYIYGAWGRISNVKTLVYSPGEDSSLHCFWPSVHTILEVCASFALGIPYPGQAGISYNQLLTIHVCFSTKCDDDQIPGIWKVLLGCIEKDINIFLMVLLFINLDD